MNNCICKGNLRSIVKEYEPLLDRKFKEFGTETTWMFYGIVISSDDYYYGLLDGDGNPLLVSCVGDLKELGYILVDKK